MKKFLLTMACALGIALGINAVTVTDVLTVKSLNLSEDDKKLMTYAEFTVTGESGAKYNLVCAHNKGQFIQITSGLVGSGEAKSYPGIVVTESAGKVKSITIKWNTETDASRVVNIYTSESKYSSPDDIAGNNASTYVAQMKCSDANNSYSEYPFAEGSEPQYIGMRSSRNAIYLDEIKIVWEKSDATQPAVAAPKITCVNNVVTITAGEGTEVYYTTDGKEPSKDQTVSSTSKLYKNPFTITETTTVKAIAYKGNDVSSVATFEAKYIVTYDNYAALVAVGDDVEGLVNNVTGIYKNGDHLYTVDSEGGFMLLRDANKFAGLTKFDNGDQFASVAGTYDASKVQMTGVTLGAKTKGTAVQPAVVTIEKITKEMINKYVRIENVTIVNGSSSNNYDMTDESGTINLYNAFRDANKYDKTVTVNEGIDFTVTGFVSIYNETVQITPILIEGGQVMERVAVPTFSVKSGTVEAGTIVQITTATEEATIYYTTGKTEPYETWIPYEGNIIINENTKIRAIAVKEGMIDSKVATAWYTIKDPNATSVTFDFSKPESLNPKVDKPTTGNGTNVDNKIFTNDIVTITLSDKVNHSSLTPRIYNSNEKLDLRLYKSQFFTVSLSGKYILEDIKFEHYKGDDLSDIVCSNGTYAKDDKTHATWTRPNEIDVETVNKVTFTATDGFYFTKLTVNYKPGTPTGVDNIAVDDENAPAVYYNLQGVRVDNPGPGLYIVRRGNTATKTLVR